MQTIEEEKKAIGGKRSITKAFVTFRSMTALTLM